MSILRSSTGPRASVDVDFNGERTFLHVGATAQTLMKPFIWRSELSRLRREICWCRFLVDPNELGRAVSVVIIVIRAFSWRIDTMSTGVGLVDTRISGYILRPVH